MTTQEMKQDGYGNEYSNVIGQHNTSGGGIQSAFEFCYYITGGTKLVGLATELSLVSKLL